MGKWKDRDWASLREIHNELYEQLQVREGLSKSLEVDSEVRNLFLNDVEALVDLVGKLLQ